MATRKVLYQEEGRASQAAEGDVTQYGAIKGFCCQAWFQTGHNFFNPCSNKYWLKLLAMMFQQDSWKEGRPA